MAAREHQPRIFKQQQHLPDSGRVPVSENRTDLNEDAPVVWA